MEADWKCEVGAGWKTAVLEVEPADEEEEEEAKEEGEMMGGRRWKGFAT